MTEPSNNDSQTEPRGRFAPGNPGGPGRPEGSRNKATILLDQLADGDAEKIVRKVLDAANDGDLKAAEMILARVWPVRKGRRVSLNLPAVSTPQDVVAAISAVLEATAEGDVTPDEAALIATLLETKRKALETVSIEERIAKLEAAKG
jgi:hypothetical protein